MLDDAEFCVSHALFAATSECSDFHECFPHGYICRIETVGRRGLPSLFLRYCLVAGMDG